MTEEADEADTTQDARGQARRREGTAPLGGREPDPDEHSGRAVLTHASWFSGVGGMDLGLERAGWRTVSFSEIDPYASAVLAERWPGVPNLGDIVLELQADSGHEESRRGSGHGSQPASAGGRSSGVVGSGSHEEGGDEWKSATLWTGGFPCQDLSVAGKRRGLAGDRSGLAFAFLDLVERYRPPLILLENVPGLLSSHGGRDMAALLGAMVELGYGVAYRIIDARYSGVPQRRRRIFIVGVRVRDDDPDGRAAAYGAASILAVGTRGCRHSAKGDEAGSCAAAATGDGLAYAVRTEQGKLKQGWNQTFAVDGTPPDADGMRATDGVAGRSYDRGRVEAFVKAGRAQTSDDAESWKEGDVMPTLNAFDVGDTRTTAAIIGPSAEADLDPLGLDSHRYRCCGNGVVAPVAEWLGVRLRRYVEGDL